MLGSGRHRLNIELVSADILDKIRARDNLRSRDPASPSLQQMNDEITKTTTSETNMETVREDADTSQTLPNCGELSKQ